MESIKSNARAIARAKRNARELREAARCMGPWRQFVTLGFPPNGMSIRQAWHRVRRARALFIKRLERNTRVKNFGIAVGL
jgi:hypothetical protein